jgi:hypothetical protein
MLLSGIIFYYLRTRISMLEQSVVDQAQLLQQVVTSLKSSQYRQQQQMNANVATNINAVSTQQQYFDNNSSNQIQNTQMNLIQVSDDSDSDSDSDSSSNDDGDSESGSESDNRESGNNVCTVEDDDGSCKIIDLSTISSSTNYLKPLSDIKVIELKSNTRSINEYIGNSSDDDDDDDGDDDDDDDGDGDGDGDDDEDNNDGDDEYKNDNKNEHGESKNNELENNVNINIKKMKSIVVEDLSTSVSLDEMKNMPVNSLRSLAKTKLSNIDAPTINKMSKKDILKALHHE